MPLTVHCLHGTGDEELEAVKLCLQEASSQGAWLLLHNAHTCPALLAQLPALLESHPPRESWKVWLSASGHAHIPIPLLQSACKVVLDSPKVGTALLAESIQWHHKRHGRNIRLLYKNHSDSTRQSLKRLLKPKL